jgi:hypothetical protein
LHNSCLTSSTVIISPTTECIRREQTVYYGGQAGGNIGGLDARFGNLTKLQDASMNKLTDDLAELRSLTKLSTSGQPRRTTTSMVDSLYGWRP